MEMATQILCVVVGFSWLAIAGAALAHSKSGLQQTSSIGSLAAGFACAVVSTVTAVAFIVTGIWPVIATVISSIATVATVAVAVRIWLILTNAPDKGVASANESASAKHQELLLQLDDANRRLRDLSEISCDWIWQTDTEGRLTYLSDGIRNSLGYGPERLLGSKLRGLAQQIISRQSGTGPLTVANRTPFRDHAIKLANAAGKVRTLRISGAPCFDSDNRYIGYRGIGTDITPQVLLQEEQAAMQAKDGFLATMSHEMRTPLNGLLGVLELLAETKLTEQQAFLLNTAQKSSTSLLELINEVLDLSKIRAGRFELHPTSCDLVDVINNTVATLVPLAEKSGNTLALGELKRQERAVVVDAQRYRQVLTNLIANAIKFTSDGSITVAVEIVPLSESHIEVRTSVQDTGVGISPEMQAKVFDEFTTIRTDADRNIQGTGLGLSLCQRLVRAMGGEIKLVSEPGEGSQFSFALKLELGEVLAVSPPQDAAEQAVETPARTLNILLVEDNDTNAMVASRMLASVGHKTTRCENGALALESYKAARFDVILMDVSMPVMSGTEATQKIRKIERSTAASKVPIIGLTAHAGSAERDRIIASGMNSCLSKPVRKAELLGELERVVQAHTSEPQPRPDAPDVQTANTDNTKPKPAASGKTNEQETPVIDIQALRTLADEAGHDAMPHLAELFAKEMLSRCELIQSAVKDNNLSQFEQHCHAIAGSASSIGALRLYKLSRHLEEACAKSGNIGLLKHSAALERETKIALASIKPALKSIQGGTKPPQRDIGPQKSANAA